MAQKVRSSQPHLLVALMRVDVILHIFGRPHPGSVEHRKADNAKDDDIFFHDIFFQLSCTDASNYKRMSLISETY